MLMVKTQYAFAI